MATVNLTRADKNNYKLQSCFATVELDYTSNVPTSGDIYEVFVLPKLAYVVSAEMIVITASDAVSAATADVGFAGGDTLLDGVNLKSAAGVKLSGGTNAAVPAVKATGGTVTFKPTYTGETTVGKWRLVIQYLEYTKYCGELTNFSET